MSEIVTEEFLDELIKDGLLVMDGDEVNVATSFRCKFDETFENPKVWDAIEEAIKDIKEEKEKHEMVGRMLVLHTVVSWYGKIHEDKLPKVCIALYPWYPIDEMAKEAMKAEGEISEHIGG